MKSQIICLFCYFFAILDKDAFVGFTVEHAALQVEVTVGTVGINRSDDGLDATGIAFGKWDVTFVIHIILVAILASVGALLVELL